MLYGIGGNGIASHRIAFGYIFVFALGRWCVAWYHTGWDGLGSYWNLKDWDRYLYWN